ncbi:MAG: AAA family ATPase [Legionellales bacterium]|nr:AAA family ATPase [Legionellales bacterium]
MIIILFGLSGAGKHHVGQVLSEYSHFHFWDADEAITDDMKRCIEEKRLFSEEIRDDYFERVMNHMDILHKEHGNIVVSQAFYKNKNRYQCLKRFSDTLFIHVTANKEILLARLAKRETTGSHGRAIIDEGYWEKMGAHFEAPTHAYVSINNDDNDNDESLVEQLSAIPCLNHSHLAFMKTK